MDRCLRPPRPLCRPPPKPSGPTGFRPIALRAETRFSITRQTGARLMTKSGAAANKEGCDEVVYLNERDEEVEANTTNVRAAPQADGAGFGLRTVAWLSQARVAR